MEEKRENEPNSSWEKRDSHLKVSNLQNDRNGFLDTLSNTPTKSAKKKKLPRPSLRKPMLEDDEKKEKESIKHEKYNDLDDVLSLWYTAQDQLAKGKNPELVTKYGIRLNAPKLIGKNKVLKMVTEIRRHTDLMSSCRNRDPSSVNEEDDEDVDEGDGVGRYVGSNVPQSCRGFKELKAPRHEPVGYNKKGIL